MSVHIYKLVANRVEEVAIEYLDENTKSHPYFTPIAHPSTSKLYQKSKSQSSHSYRTKEAPDSQNNIEKRKSIYIGRFTHQISKLTIKL